MFGMCSYHQSIHNRWNFNICFNVWVVVGWLFPVRVCQQRPPCFWPDLKPQNAIPPPSHHTGLLLSLKQYFNFLLFQIHLQPLHFHFIHNKQTFIIRWSQTRPKHLKKGIVLRDYCPVSHQTWKDLVRFPLMGAKRYWFLHRKTQ